jgi:hypothetical protein
MLGNIQKFRWAVKNTELYTITFNFHCFNLWKKILNVFLKKKLQSEKRNCFYRRKTVKNENIINSMPDRSYHVLGVQLSLKQNLNFIMRKEKVNPMECDCPIPFGALFYMVTESIINNQVYSQIFVMITHIKKAIYKICWRNKRTAVRQKFCFIHETFIEYSVISTTYFPFFR